MYQLYKYNNIYYMYICTVISLVDKVFVCASTILNEEYSEVLTVIV